MPFLQERLEREHDLTLIMTSPTVVYKCVTQDGKTHTVRAPSHLPENRVSISEPFVRMEVIAPSEFNGPLMELCQQRRGASRSASWQSS
jgi:translation elongation factor EF-4